VSEAGPDYAAAATALAAAERIVVVTHENPDGDALGSLIGALRGLRAAGKAVEALVADAPVPREYRWLTGDDTRVTTTFAAPYTLLAVDCGSGARVACPESVRAGATCTVNVDHHHDNTRFGDVNVVDAGAACATIMVAEVLGRLGVEIEATIGLALYVGLVTDTGRFQYSNTDARALRFAADLAARGVQPHEVFVRVYEAVPAARVRLLGLALGRLELRLAGRIALTSVTREDLASTGADEAASDGVIDHLRAIDGVELAALIREPASGPRYKVSLRSQSGAVDVSAIAHAAGGGGHPRAAGFSSDLALQELVAFIEREASAGGI
jgi:phosphoesterase RecJ-like protein